MRAQWFDDPKEVLTLLIATRWALLLYGLVQSLQRSRVISLYAQVGGYCSGASQSDMIHMRSSAASSSIGTTRGSSRRLAGKIKSPRDRMALMAIFAAGTLRSWLFPPAASDIIQLLPFSFVAYHPMAVDLGKPDVAATLSAFGVGAGWIVVLTGCAALRVLPALASPACPRLPTGRRRFSRLTW